MENESTPCDRSGLRIQQSCVCFYLYKPTVYSAGKKQWVASRFQCAKNAWKHKNVSEYCRWHHRWWVTQFSHHQPVMWCSKVTAKSGILFSPFNWKPNLNTRFSAYGQYGDTVKTTLKSNDIYNNVIYHTITDTTWTSGVRTDLKSVVSEVQVWLFDNF